MSEEADRIIAALDLKPHPEGGHYRETFRDPATTNGRAHSTAIYFILKAGEISREFLGTKHWWKNTGAQMVDLTIADIVNDKKPATMEKMM